MESRNSEMPCKIRKRRFPTASSSSFANNNISQFLVEKTRSDSPRNEKCINMLDRSKCKEEESATTMTVKKSDTDNRVNKVIDKSITNVDRSRNKSRTSSGRVATPEVRLQARSRSDEVMKKKRRTEEVRSAGCLVRSAVAPSKTRSGTLAGVYAVAALPEKFGPFGEVETETKNQKRSMLKPTNELNEIKQSLTISRELLKLLTHVWTVDTNRGCNSMTISLSSTLNHELNKARSQVNKLIQEQRSHNTTSSESYEQDKVRFAIRTVARELEIEKKLRRQTERMNKKLGRELANTKSSLSKAIEKSETEKRATEILEQLCEKMALEIEEDRIELEELKKESERVREEMEEEREMLRVADILREERVHMKLSDAKYEYEDRHAQVNMIARDLEELLEVDNNTNHLKKKIPRVLSWYESTANNNGEDENNTRDETTSLVWYENNSHKVVNDENALGEKLLNKGEVVNDENTLLTRDVSWYENENENDNDKGEVEIYGNIIREETTSTVHEAMERYNSDCIELEFGLDRKNESEEEVLGISHCSYNMKEYEDEMERYKMIKDLRDRIVSGSDLSLGSYT
ncbi:hypothetical protein Ccrd_006524 [Cynara cardunculus var. scolymus]|uniref:Uncharacterized protein n=1 Tax=Cynara cardunculus var. scolymus TaxID=59895 RepID=A0A103XIM3_CYNCS|nr:hypothetical protein Ccrd_006524 [Cynara cardunculus var. scolymus]